MKYFRQLVWLLLSPIAFAQGGVQYNGNYVAHGNVIINLGSGGNPLQYNARTDNCGLGNPAATGYEYGCTSTIPGVDGGPMIFQERPGDTYASGAIPFPPFAFNNTSSTIVTGCTGLTTTGGFGTGVTDPDFHSQLIMVSDPCNSLASLTTLFSMSETNDSTDVSNTDSTMFFIIKSGGGTLFFYLNPTYAHAHACSPSGSWTGGTLCLNLSTIQGVATPSDHCAGGVGTSCTQMYNSGVTFSHKPGEANIAYESSQNGLIVYRDTICRNLASGPVDSVCSALGGTASLDTFNRTVYANFADPTYGVLPSDYQQLWHGTFGLTADGGSRLAMGGGGSYQTIGTGVGGAQALTPDTVILPVNNNARWVLPASPATTFSGSNPTSVTFPFTPSGDTIPNPPTTPHVVITGLNAACNGQWPVTAWSTPSGGPYAVTVSITGTITSCSGYPGNIGYADTGYQASSGTTAGGSEPNWMSTCQGVGDVCTDGTSSWTAIGNLNGQGPGFDLVTYGPPGSTFAAGYSRVNTRLGKVYRGYNEGPSYPSSGTADPGQAYVACGTGGRACGSGTGYGSGTGTMYTNDGLMCIQYGLSIIPGTPPVNGVCPTPIPFTEYFTFHDSGTLLNPQFAELSPTGGGSGTSLLNQPYSPQNTVPMCLPSAATWRTDVNGGQWLSTYSYSKNDAVYGAGGDYANLYVSSGNGNLGNTPSSTHSSSGPWYGAGDANAGPSYCYRYTWQPATNVINPCMLRHDPAGANNFGDCPGHSVHGYISEWGDSLLVSHLYQQFTLNGFSTSEIATAPIGTSCTGLCTPGIQLLPSPNGIPADQHGTARSENSTDTNPSFSANTEVPTRTYGQIDAANPGQSAGYSEFTGFFTPAASFSGGQYFAAGGSPPCTTQVVGVGGKPCFYRFAHSYNDGMSSDFGAQNNISTVFQAGDFVLMPSTVMGTRGSTSTAAWQSNHSYSYGTYLYPVSDLNSNGYEWVVVSPTSGTCTSGASPSPGEPNWNSSSTTITDGSCTWRRQSGSCNAELSHVTLPNGTVYSNVSRWSPENVTTMSAGDIMFPVGNNGDDNLYVAINSGTISGSTPNWNDPSVGCPNYGNQCTWGGVTLQSIGPDTCRPDIILVDLLSAH